MEDLLTSAVNTDRLGSVHDYFQYTLFWYLRIQDNSPTFLFNDRTFYVVSLISLRALWNPRNEMKVLFINHKVVNNYFIYRKAFLTFCKISDTLVRFQIIT